LCRNKRSDTVALNGGGNEEELRDDAYDTNASNKVDVESTRIRRQWGDYTYSTVLLKISL
jgi:hypothetical protein